MSDSGGPKTGRPSAGDKDRRTSDRVNQQRQLQARRHLSADDYGALGSGLDYEVAIGADTNDTKSRNQLRRRVGAFYFLLFSVFSLLTITTNANIYSHNLILFRSCRLQAKTSKTLLLLAYISQTRCTSYYWKQFSFFVISK